MEASAIISYNVQSNVQLKVLRGCALSEKHTRFLREIIEIVTFTLLVLFIIRFAVQSFRTDGQSMEPNFHSNEYVLVNKVTYLLQQPQRGDVVVFHYPFDIHKDFIKRLIGLPGDTIHVTNATVTINGQAIREPYIRVPFNFENKTWKLGANQFFVMGDNRDNSLDSRTWGPLDRSYIIGKVVAAYWPMNYLGFIDTYSAVYAAVPLGK
jgi:signal peptidase I